jgi:hypothetical protein
MAKPNPGKLAYGHGSSGSLVSAALLGQMAGLDFSECALQEHSTRIDRFCWVANCSLRLPMWAMRFSQMNGGRLKGLGVTTAKRAGKAPQVPPIGDTVRDYAMGAWFRSDGALLACQRTSRSKSVRHSLAVMAKPEVREKIQNAGIDVDYQDSAQLAKTHRLRDQKVVGLG